MLLLTVEKLRDADWPREAIDEVFYIPEELPLQGLINAVSYMARWRPIDRIVALDEFDMENVAALREHLRIPGMGLTTMRYFRDKLAMRGRAKEEGIAVPEFVHVLNYDELAGFHGARETAMAVEAALASLGHRDEENRGTRSSSGRGSSNSATSNHIICSNNSCPAMCFTWIASSRNAKWYSPKRTRTEGRRSMCLTKAECSPRARCRGLRRHRKSLLQNESRSDPGAGTGARRDTRGIPARAR